VPNMEAAEFREDHHICRVCPAVGDEGSMGAVVAVVRRMRDGRVVPGATARGGVIAVPRGDSLNGGHGWVSLGVSRWGQMGCRR